MPSSRTNNLFWSIITYRLLPLRTYYILTSYTQWSAALFTLLDEFIPFNVDRQIFLLKNQRSYIIFQSTFMLYTYFFYIIFKCALITWFRSVFLFLLYQLLTLDTLCIAICLFLFCWRYWGEFLYFFELWKFQPVFTFKLFWLFF